ncbi:hypothetical protein [Streptomyces lasiicapitis]|uniref:hypothetical protein n=1 Tax=Streptomyces lasiicapitis TaxID=1923961 RepID=UPI003668208C
MISVKELDAARPQQWRDAADDALGAAKQCATIADYARDEMASTLKAHWAGDAGRAARAKFVKHADDYEAAEIALKAMAKAYDDLAADITDAQRDLRSGLDYATRHGLKVYPSGRAELAGPMASAPGEDAYEAEADRHILHATQVVSAALEKASRADTEAAARLRTIEGLIAIKDPELARQALDPNSPLAIALRLSGGRDGVHPINVPQSVLDAVDRASRETGVSRKLLLATLWQEQQWYQNREPGLRGPLSEVGRFGEWLAAQTFMPSKSMGITHVKMATARKVFENNPGVFTMADGRPMSTLDDRELAAVIEHNPELSVRLSAHLLADLRKDPEGSDTDKQLFVLYAADTGQVRGDNERYGDESEYRENIIHTRGESWDKVEPHIDDAMAWQSLTDKQRADAISKLESQAPAGHYVPVDPIYGDRSGGEGTGAPEPDTPPRKPGEPSPEPGTPPTPPEGN